MSRARPHAESLLEASTPCARAWRHQNKVVGIACADARVEIGGVADGRPRPGCGQLRARRNDAVATTTAAKCRRGMEALIITPPVTRDIEAGVNEIVSTMALSIAEQKYAVTRRRLARNKIARHNMSAA